jgi:hypothetical protein
MALTHEEFYKSCNLTHNPFRTNPTLESDPRRGIWVGYNKQQQTLFKIISRSRADQVGNINFAIVYGELGVGKTHALLWSQYQILVKEKNVFNGLAYYIPTLKKDKGQLSFAGAFESDVISKSSIVSDILIFKQFLEDLTIEYKHDNGLGPEVTREQALEKILPSSDLLNLARQILKCESEAQVKSLLAVKGDYAAMLLFTKLVNLFVFEFKLSSGTRRFKKAVYLFIDELDLLARCTAKEARELNDLLRHIYDACPDCFCMILAFTATSAELGVLFAEYVLSRVTHQVVFDFLQPHEAKEFICEILDTARINDKKNQNCYPFSEEAIDTIVSGIVSITPRKLVTRMQQIIEEVRLAGVNPKEGLITSQILDDKSIWEEVI